jgi:HD-like signal output (HDOD) protein
MTIDEICQNAQQIPASPAILPSLLALLAREEASLVDLKRIVKQDTSLSVAVLRMANSAAMGGGVKFENLDDAILRLGFGLTYKLVVTVAGGRWNSIDMSGYSWAPGDFFRHSLAVAVAARSLAIELDSCQPELAYTAGLMHEAGKLALVFSNPLAIGRARAKQAELNCDWLEAERLVLGFNHTDISRSLLEGWSFPESLLDVVKFYPTPAQSAPEFRPLVETIHLAKHLAIQTGIGAGEDAFWLPVDNLTLNNLGAQDLDFEDIIASVVEELRYLLKDALLTGPIINTTL